MCDLYAANNRANSIAMIYMQQITDIEMDIDSEIHHCNTVYVYERHEQYYNEFHVYCSNLCNQLANF